MVNWRNYSNNAIADTLLVTGGGGMSTGSPGNGVGSIYAGSGAPVGYPTSFPFILNIEPGTANQELVNVVSGAGTAASPWVLGNLGGVNARGADGTTARAHIPGVPIWHTMSAADLAAAATHEAAAAGQLPHGLPAAAWLTGAFATLAETVTTPGQTSVSSTLGTTTGSWSAIPGTYKHLLISGQGRLTEPGNYSDDLQLTFNGDSSAVYSYLTLAAANPAGAWNANYDITTAVSTPWAPTGVLPGPANNTGFALTAAPVLRLMASGFGSGANAGGGFVFIPNYAGATFNKTFYSVSGGGDGTSSFVDLRVRVGIYAPAVQGAITAISMAIPGAASALVAGSAFGLYAFG